MSMCNNCLCMYVWHTMSLSKASILEGMGDATPDFGMRGSWVMRTLSKVVTFQKWKDLCVLNKNSGDDTNNSVLCTSFCWTFKTHTPKFSNLDLRPSFFKTRLMPLKSVVVFILIFLYMCSKVINCSRFGLGTIQSTQLKLRSDSSNHGHLWIFFYSRAKQSKIGQFVWFTLKPRCRLGK